ATARLSTTTRSAAARGSAAGVAADRSAGPRRLPAADGSAPVRRAATDPAERTARRPADACTAPWPVVGGAALRAVDVRHAADVRAAPQPVVVRTAVRAVGVRAACGPAARRYFVR